MTSMVGLISLWAPPSPYAVGSYKHTQWLKVRDAEYHIPHVVPSGANEPVLSA